MRLLHSIALSLAFAATVPNPKEPANLRLIVLTDISSLTSGVREPDDGQSLIRLLLYANEFEIEGLVASSNMQHGQVVRPELIHEAIDAYEKDFPNLVHHDSAYPPAETLRQRVKSGQPIAFPKLPDFRSIGAGKDTEASDWIIRVVDRPDPRPVWITIWGGSADLAQALWKVRETRTPAETDAFVSKLRVHTIGYQDSTGDWIAREFPSLFLIKQGNSMRGMYRGGDTSLSTADWVETHIRSGKGALGALYPNYDGGDIWSSVHGVKEGDTPSFLGLIPNGLSVPEQPEMGGWGGRFKRVEGYPNRFMDEVDPFPGAEKDRAPGMATVYRWRDAYQADFKARLDWCATTARGNHPPVPAISGGPRRTAAPGGVVDLDARKSRDPNGDQITFEWSVYPSSSSGVRFDQPNSARTRLRIPADAYGPIHVLLTVRDNGTPALTRYARVTIEIDRLRR